MHTRTTLALVQGAGPGDCLRRRVELLEECLDRHTDGRVLLCSPHQHEPRQHIEVLQLGWLLQPRHPIKLAHRHDLLHADPLNLLQRLLHPRMRRRQRFLGELGGEVAAPLHHPNWDVVARLPLEVHDLVAQQLLQRAAGNLPHVRRPGSLQHLLEGHRILLAELVTLLDQVQHHRVVGLVALAFLAHCLVLSFRKPILGSHHLAIATSN